MTDSYTCLHTNYQSLHTIKRKFFNVYYNLQNQKLKILTIYNCSVFVRKRVYLAPCVQLF